ncbi:MAG: permease [Actinobacteria bacterium]|nr:permease [Actinomycetota bacterium]
MNQLQGKNIDKFEGLEKEKYQKELKKQKDKKKTIIRDYLIMSGIIVVFVVLYFVFPAKGEVSLKNSWQFFIEMMEILPAVTILIGILSVWATQEMVTKYLGKESGFKGFLIALLMGTLPAGPLYIGFPIAKSLRMKGASVGNMVTYLSVFAAIKLPQLLMEWRFLGWKFTLLRFPITVVLIYLMSMIVDVIFKKTEKKVCNFTING